MERSRRLSSFRFWGLWLIGLLVALSLFLPHLLEWVKAFGLLSDS